MPKPTILIVDSDQSTCEFLKVALNEEGYAPILWSTEDNQPASLGEVPNLVLLDVPGFEANKAVFIRRFRERLGADVPIIILTTDLHPEAVAKEAHASGFVGKPFDLDHLLRVIASNLGSAGIGPLQVLH
jgi:DNA-binding response OmpR family regulator